MLLRHITMLLLPSVLMCASVGGAEEIDGATRLKNLRALMSSEKVSAYIVPSLDDHLNEYLLDGEARRSYLTGFTGSSGVAVVTEDKAALWTDSRYYIQAERQMDSELWTLMKLGEEGIPKIHEWLASNLKNGSYVGVDPRKIDAVRFETDAKSLEKKGIQLIPVLPNLVDKIWKDRPPYPENNVYPYDIKYAGEKWEDKVARLQQKLKGGSLVVSALDEVAWLTNLRGSDFQYTPLFRAFIILNGDQLTLYIPAEKVTPCVKEHLNSKTIKVVIENYDKFWDGLIELGKTSNDITLPTLKNGGTSYFIKSQLPKDKCHNKTSPIMEMKACKNEVEAEGIRRAHIRDSVALCQLMYQLTSDIEDGNSSVVWDEMRVVSELERLRSEQLLNKGSSFATIAAFGHNSALPHYQVTNETNLKIDNKGPLTIDSGGQYLDGTIDTTRVVRAGIPSEIEIRVYTALLQGVIDLATTVFPEGTRMVQLDFIARRPLFQEGRDFGHGVTHGTGCFLNVHESYNGTLHEHFVGSQEPGYYKENNFGMRLENLMIVVPAKVENHTKKKLLMFEPLTLVPYERKLIDVAQLDKKEIMWLNDYHKKVRRLVGAEMLKQNQIQLHQWLFTQTQPLTAQDAMLSI